MRLWHISDDPGIDCFEPRRPPGAAGSLLTPVVWAVDERHLVNYLVPRECPRVAFHAAPDSTAADVAHFMGPAGARHVVAIPSPWFERAAACTLWAYELAAGSFACADAVAGYFVATVAVTPVSCRRIDRPLSELLASGAELRVVADLPRLADAVAASSLAFSCIRMRNAGA